MSEKTYSLEITIQSLLEHKRYPTIKDILVTLNAADIAAIFAELSPEALPLLFRLLPKELAAETFAELDADQQQLLITRFSDTELKEVIDELYIDDAVDLVEEMPANVVKRILSQADPDTRKLINELLNYPEDSAGSIMTTEFVELGISYTVADAIKTIRRTGLEKETINDCFVTGGDKEVGGDLYDYVDIDKDHVAVLIGDVSGKGIPAAMFMMKTITSFRDAATSGKMS